MIPRSEPSAAEKRRFQEAAEPKWRHITTLLAADRPPEWEGYRFEATVETAASDDRFTIQAKFGDRVSNRQRGRVDRAIIDLLAEHHVACVGFWPVMAWKRVVIEQIWERETKSWAYERKFEY